MYSARIYSRHPIIWRIKPSRLGSGTGDFRAGQYSGHDFFGVISPILSGAEMPLWYCNTAAPSIASSYGPKSVRRCFTKSALPLFWPHPGFCRPKVLRASQGCRQVFRPIFRVFYILCYHRWQNPALDKSLASSYGFQRQLHLPPTGL